MASEAHKVVATAGIVSVGVGSLNSVFKDQKPPSSKFLIGSGLAFFILSALADMAPELAKGLAIGVATTVVLGEGGGVLSYINHGEMNTAKRHKPQPKPPTKADKAVKSYPVVTVRVTPGNGYKPSSMTPIPGMSHPVNNGNPNAQQ